MELSRVILGPVITEKAERLKAAGERHIYTLRVAPDATKPEIKKALKRFYDLDVLQVRVMRVGAKTRTAGKGQMEKRHAFKKALVSLKPKSKPLDLAAFLTTG